VSVHTLTALALSPVHVGDGSELLPEAYKLDGDALVRFDPSAVVASLDDRRRQAFLAAIGRQAVGESELREAQRVLRDACTPALERERIAVSQASRREIGQALENPGRRGNIHPFARASGRPFLPGSALKGAIRTALLSEWVQESLPAHRNWLESRKIGGGKSGRESSELQGRVLGETDSDPFRFLRVADVELPAGCTRIEWRRTWKRKGGLDPGTKGMQMHFECIRPGTRFAMTLDVRAAGGTLATAERVKEAAARGGETGKAPKRILADDELLRAIDAFYRGRWQAEMRSFFPQAWRPEPPAAGADGFPLLLRVGRFSHFESASVDGLRRGWRPQAGRTIEEGSTRAVVGFGDSFAPFGWLLLVPAGREAVLDGLVAPPQPAERPREAPGRGRPAAAGLVGRRGTVGDQPVEVVRDDGSELTVRYLDTGDIESARRDDFKPED